MLKKISKSDLLFVDSGCEYTIRVQFFLHFYIFPKNVWELAVVFKFFLRFL